jgi:DNA relaxase NicK
MKFEVEISEERIQERLDSLMNYEDYQARFTINDIIHAAVKEAIKEVLVKDFKISIPEKIKEAANKEIEKATEQKIVGWAKRHVKELIKSIEGRY